MKVLILQPPVMQLNTAYPSGAYLSSFFTSLGCSVQWKDLNIELFYEIFSRKGLEKLFSLCADKAILLADKAEKSGDDATAFNLRRYVSERNLLDRPHYINTARAGTGKRPSFCLWGSCSPRLPHGKLPCRPGPRLVYR